MDYDWSEFEWVSSGHDSPEAALAAYRRQHCNPGGYTEIPDRSSHEQECQEYDRMLSECRKQRR